MDTSPRRKLLLHKETIRRLTRAELDKVAGRGARIEDPGQDTDTEITTPSCEGTCFQCASVDITCEPYTCT